MGALARGQSSLVPAATILGPLRRSMTLSLIQSLCLLLAAAHLLGRLAERAGQPELLGHMLAGIVLGPAVLNWVQASTGINTLADIAVLFVVITAGLEMRLRTIATVFNGHGSLALLPSFLLPGCLALVLALWFDYKWNGALMVALCVSVTALPVALRILSSFGLLATRIAQVSIAGALMADIVVLLTLGVLSPNAQSAGHGVALLIGFSALKLMALLMLVVVGALLCKFIYKRNAWHRQKLANAQLSLALLLVLLLAAASELLGFHFAIGAFLGALIVSEYHSDTGDSHPLRAHVEGMSTHVFAPLFLACQGTHFTTDSFLQPAFTVLLVLVAVSSKLLGGYWTARLYGLPRNEAQGVAIIMNARGVMEMVIAAIAYRAGLVDANLFSILLLVGVVTTVCTPLMLKRWQKRSTDAMTSIPTQTGES